MDNSSVLERIVCIISWLDDVSKETWFTAPAELGRQLALFRHKCDLFRQSSSPRGLTRSSGRLPTEMLAAEASLSRMHWRVKRLQMDIENSSPCLSCIFYCRAKLSMTIFPIRLERVIETLNGLIDVALEERAVEDTLRRWEDERFYVPIEKTQSAVIEAIEDLYNRRPFILLHGGGGTGKSTLARFIVTLYAKDGQKGDIFEYVHWKQCGNKSDKSSTIQSEILLHLSPAMFPMRESSEAGLAAAFRQFLLRKRVLIILDDVVDKDLLNDLLKTTPDGGVKYLITSRRADLCASGLAVHSTAIRMEKPNKNEAKQILASRAGFGVHSTAIRMEKPNKNKDGQILEPILDSLAGLLVHSTAIRLENPNKKEARQILASLAGLELIPADFQDRVDTVIAVTSPNPLALASLAGYWATGHNKFEISSFADKITCRDPLALANHVTDCRTRFEMRTRHEASKSIANVLESEPTRFELDSSATKSFMKMMRQTLDSLERDFKVILFFVYACKGKSVSEAILRIWYNSTGRNVSFDSCINELLMMELLRPSPGANLASEKDPTDEEYWQQSRAWSLQSLVKLCMDRHLAASDEIKKAFDDLLCGHDFGAESSGKRGPESSEIKAGGSENKTLAIALCALYFDDRTGGEVTAAAKRASTIIKWRGSESTDSVRKKIEPIIGLFDQLERNDKGAITCAGYATEIFLKYVGECQLDYDNICELLNWAGVHPPRPLVTLATLTYVTDMFLTEELPPLKQNSVNILVTLVQIIQKEVQKGVEEEVRTQVQNEVLPSIQRPKNGTLGGSLESTSHCQPSIQEAASKTLLAISRKAARDKSASIVANKPGVVAVLVRWIQDSLTNRDTRQPDSSDVLAENAVATLWNLASGREESIRTLLRTEHGVLKTLEDSACIDDSPVLQSIATQTWNLLSGTVAEGQSSSTEISKQGEGRENLGDEIAPECSVKRASESSKAVEQLFHEVLFDHTNTHEVVAGGATSSDYKQRRNAIEPLRPCLPHEPDLKEVYLKYVSGGQLDYDKISGFLKISGHRFTPDILSAIESIFHIQSAKPKFSKENSQTEPKILHKDSQTELFLKALVNLMHSSGSEPVKPKIQEAASKALHQISRTAVNEELTALFTSNILTVLVQSIQYSLSTRQSDALATSAARTLREVGYRLTYKLKKDTLMCEDLEVLQINV